MRKPSIDIELLDRKLYSLVSIGRESNPVRIAKIEKMRSEVIRYADMSWEELPKVMKVLSQQTYTIVASQEISEITLCSLLQKFDTILGKNSTEQMDAIQDFDSIRMTIACLSYYVVLVCENFDEEYLARLFAQSFELYEELSESNLLELEKMGPGWRKRVGGILPFSSIFQSSI